MNDLAKELREIADDALNGNTGLDAGAPVSITAAFLYLMVDALRRAAVSLEQPIKAEREDIIERLLEIAHCAWHLLEDSGETERGEYLHMQRDHEALEKSLNALIGEGEDIHSFLGAFRSVLFRRAATALDRPVDGERKPFKMLVDNEWVRRSAEAEAECESVEAGILHPEAPRQPPAEPSEAQVEAVARALCIADENDPDAVDYKEMPQWKERRYMDEAKKLVSCGLDQHNLHISMLGGTYALYFNWDDKKPLWQAREGEEAYRIREVILAALLRYRALVAAGVTGRSGVEDALRKLARMDQARAVEAMLDRDAAVRLLNGFMGCAEIADCAAEDKDPETIALEREARAFVAKLLEPSA